MSSQKKLWMSSATALSAMSLVLAPAVLAPSMAFASPPAQNLSMAAPTAAEPGETEFETTFNFSGDQEAIDFFADKVEENEGNLSFNFTCESDEAGEHTQTVWTDPDFIRAGNFSTNANADESLIGSTGCQITGNGWTSWFAEEDIDIQTSLGEGQGTFDLEDAGTTVQDWNITLNTIEPLSVENDAFEVRSGNAQQLDVLANDSVKSDAPLTLVQEDAETGEPEDVGTIELEEGTFQAVNAESGERYVEFTPAEGFEGSVPAVNYRVADTRALKEIDQDVDGWEGRVRFLQTASLDVTVVPAEAPTSAPDNIISGYETPITFDPTINDTLNDPEATWESVELYNTEGDSVDTVSVRGGEFTKGDGNSITFTPRGGFSGEADLVEYSATDSNGNTTFNRIYVTVDDPAPIETSDDAAEGEQGEAVTVNPLENDTLSQTATEWTDLWVQGADGENVKEVSTEDGVFTVNDNLTVTFNPADDFTGESSVTYIAQDDAEETATGVINFTINAADDGDDGNNDDEDGDNGDDGTVEPGLTIDPEQISAEDFVDSEKGVNITGAGFTAGSEATLTVSADTDSVNDFERSGTVDENGVVTFERIYGVSDNADTYVGNYDVTVSGEGQDDLTGSFTVGDPDGDGTGGQDGDESENGNGGGNEGGDNAGDPDENGNNGEDNQEDGSADDSENADGARSETGGEMGTTAQVGVLGGLAALAGAIALAFSRFGFGRKKNTLS